MACLIRRPALVLVSRPCTRELCHGAAYLVFACAFSIAAFDGTQLSVNTGCVARSLSDLQRYILRRAAERGRALRYEEIIRKFYRLPRSAFPELRIAEAAISRSVRALMRRRLVDVHHVKSDARHHGNRLACVNLTDAGRAVAHLIPPSRTLPRARKITTTASEIIVWRGHVYRHHDLLGSALLGSVRDVQEQEPDVVNQLSTKEIEYIQKFARRHRLRRAWNVDDLIPPSKTL